MSSWLKIPCSITNVLIRLRDGIAGLVAEGATGARKRPMSDDGNAAPLITGPASLV